MKLLHRNIGKKLINIGHGNNLGGIIPKVWTAKDKINKWHYIKLRSFSIAKETINKRQPTKGEKIFADHVRCYWAPSQQPYIHIGGYSLLFLDEPYWWFINIELAANGIVLHAWSTLSQRVFSRAQQGLPALRTLEHTLAVHLGIILNIITNKHENV